MSAVRVFVELIFGDIINYFKFMGFEKKIKNWIKCSRENVLGMCTSTQCGSFTI